MKSLSREEILAKFDSLTVWKRGDERAPHKPLLVLYALGKLAAGEEQLSFRQVERDLTPLLEEFGPSRVSLHPEYPFWRLRNDGIWQVDAPEGILPRRSNTDAKKSELLKHDVHAGFSPEVLASLQENPSVVKEIASRILYGHFPDSIHSDILGSVGLGLESLPGERLRRDQSFRPRILTAYEYRCAVCALDLRLGGRTVALDAAHIKWHQAGGPDSVSNGIALCVMHHKTFDLGAFTIQPDLRIVVSEHATGTEGLKETLLRFHDTSMRAPQKTEAAPDRGFLAWHRKWVFKEDPRERHRP